MGTSMRFWDFIGVFKLKRSINRGFLLGIDYAYYWVFVGETLSWFLQQRLPQDIILARLALQSGLASNVV